MEGFWSLLRSWLRPLRQPQTAPRPPFLLGLAIGAGFVGLSLMALEFAFVSRVTLAAGAFGEDSLQLFHKLMGMVALGLILTHPILLIIYGYLATCWPNPLSSCANTAAHHNDYRIAIS